MIGSWSLSLLVVAALPVSGDTRCPAPAAVEALLGAPESTPMVEGPRGVLTQKPEGFEVALTDADGQVIAARVLAVSDRCEVLAEAAAVMLRSWQTELVAAAPASPRLPPRPRARFAAALELLGSGSSPRDLLSVGFAARGQLAGEGAGYLFGSLSWASPRAIAFAGGEVRFQRLAPLLAVGAGGELRWGWAIGGLEASLGVSRLALDGVGYTDPRGAWSFDLGLGGGARVRARTEWLGRFEPYLGLHGVWWATRHVAAVGAEQRVALPQQEWWASVGVQLALGNP